MEGSAIGPFAWFFMLFSMGSVTVLMAWCFYRILQSRTAVSGGRAAPEDDAPPVKL